MEDIPPLANTGLSPAPGSLGRRIRRTDSIQRFAYIIGIASTIADSLMEINGCCHLRRESGKQTTRAYPSYRASASRAVLRSAS
jgi:hypothetical protein